MVKVLKDATTSFSLSGVHACWKTSQGGAIVT